jgi:hypothetical protein
MLQEDKKGNQADQELYRRQERELNKTRAMRWCYTVNNYSDEEVKAVTEAYKRIDVTEGAVETEVGDEGTPHLQGFICFEDRKTRGFVCRLLGGRAHVEILQGSLKSNWDYCTKTGNIVAQKGQKPEDQAQLRRKKADARALQIIKDAYVMSPAQFMEVWPMEWLHRRSAIEKLMIDGQQARQKVYDGKLGYKNFWVWGSTGLGKSRWAANQAPLNETYKKGHNKWWDGFQASKHKLVIIDDWPTGQRGEALAYHLKIWGDRYPFIAEVKNSAIVLAPGDWKLIITSNFNIDEVFTNTEDQKAIKRRFCVINMNETNAAMISVTRIGDQELITEADDQESRSKDEEEEV